MLTPAVAALEIPSEEASAMLAPVEALRHIEQALQLVNTVPEPGASEYTLLRMASRTAMAAGHADRAIAYDINGHVPFPVIEAPSTSDR